MTKRMNQALTASHIRPLGLRLGAVLLLLFSIFGLVSAFAGIFTWDGSAPFIAFYILGGILALLELALVWALWSLKLWAFWSTISIEALCIVLALSVFVIWHLPSSLLTNLVFPVAIILCLFVDPNVRPAFYAHLETMHTSEPSDT
jgi:hypothetical protein